MRFGKKLKEKEYIKREGVYGIVYHKGQFGVVKVRDTHFLIGGGLDEDENHHDCLHREFLEEVGYKIDIHECIGSFTEFHQSFKSKNYYEMVGHVYLVSLIEKVSEGEDDHELVWVNKEGIEEAMTLSYQAYIIKNYQIL